MGKLSHWYVPVGVKNVVNGFDCSSILRAKYAYLRSMDENNALPCKFCNEAEISGTTDGGDCIIEVRGLKSIIRRSNSFALRLGMRYVLIPYE